MPNLHEPKLHPTTVDPRTGSPTANAFEIEPLEKEEAHHSPGIKEWCRIIWIRNGSGIFCVDMQKYPISSNTIYCIKHGQAVKFYPDNGVTGYAISFSPDFLAPGEDHTALLHHGTLFHPLSLFCMIRVEDSQLPKMLEISDKMVLECANDYAGKIEILRGLLKIFLIYLGRHREQSRHPAITLNQVGLAARFLSLLEKDFAKKKMVSAYAVDLHVTANYLNETVKKASGFPASYHIQQRIILEAKRKAAHVRTSMKEIAYGLGFADLAHFSKYFKRASGVNFTEFKKEISQALLS